MCVYVLVHQYVGLRCPLCIRRGNDGAKFGNLPTCSPVVVYAIVTILLPALLQRSSTLHMLIYISLLGASDCAGHVDGALSLHYVLHSTKTELIESTGDQLAALSCLRPTPTKRSICVDAPILPVCMYFFLSLPVLLMVTATVLPGAANLMTNAEADSRS